MNCPVCSKEMENGFLQGQQRISFVKKKHMFSILPRKGEVLLENTAESIKISRKICSVSEFYNKRFAFVVNNLLFSRL